MARYSESVCRLCRREGMKLFLKGDRCFKDKCAIERRNYPPGQHGRRRSKLLGYGIQLREKQKVKRIYGLLESQFRLAFARAERRKGITGANLLEELERRLDNVVYALGFAASRAQARQLVRHGHVAVNGRKVSIPSFRVSKGQVISIKERSRINEQIKASRRDRPGARRSGLARPDTRVLLGPRRRAAEARRHQTADSGAADRRAVLQVAASRRGAPRGLKRGEKTHDPMERFPEAQAARDRLRDADVHVR